MIDLEFIERLIQVLDESGLDHVEIERGGTRVRVSRSPPIQPVETGGGVASDGAPAAPTGESDAESGGGDLDAASEPVRDEGLVEISCPMVGTFYRSVSPDTDPFVEVGSQIGPGDPLCIIEAMKLMNELEAEVGGVIQEVCVGDGEPVEFGQALFRVRPS